MRKAVSVSVFTVAASVVMLAAGVLVLAKERVVAPKVSAPRETVAPAFQYALQNLPGKTITGVVVEYPPGGSTPPHRHGQAFVVGYVLSGAIRSRLDNGETRVYKAGESWMEAPGAHHNVGENASATEPARMLAIFVSDTGDTKLVVMDSP